VTALKDILVAFVQVAGGLHATIITCSVATGKDASGVGTAPDFVIIEGIGAVKYKVCFKPLTIIEPATSLTLRRSVL
jgi:hypothetical protein